MLYIWVYMAICSYIYIHKTEYTWFNYLYTPLCIFLHISLGIYALIYIYICVYRCFLACIYKFKDRDANMTKQ